MMRTASKTDHVLEIHDGRNTWRQPMAERYQPAKQLAWQGRIVEALEAAEEIRVREYGEMHGVRFRMITHTETVTTLGNLADALE